MTTLDFFLDDFSILHTKIVHASNKCVTYLHTTLPCAGLAGAHYTANYNSIPQHQLPVVKAATIQILRYTVPMLQVG